jgi:hypothetical protein
MAKASLRKDPLRILYIGNSGSGKTGSLISLLRAGYNIRMLDMDRNADSLLELANHEDPKLLDRIDLISLRDKFRASQISGLEVKGQPKAYVDMLKFLEKWDDGTSFDDLGPETVFVLDTLTSASRAAFHWAKGMNPTSKDPRQWYAQAQDSIKTLLELLTAPEIKCHVMVLSHIDLVEMPDGSSKGFASSVGKALGPQIAKTFPTLIVAESRGSGKNVKRTIGTMPTPLLDLKNPKPFALESEYPLDTGLATIFAKLLE